MRKIATALLLLSSLSVHAQQAVVNAVRLSSEAGNARLVLDANTEVQYKLFTIDRAPRLVIDLEDTRLGGALPSIAGAAGIVTGIRAGVQNGKDLRLVLDLKQPMAAKGGPGSRFDRQLSVDLTPGGGTGGACNTGVAAAPRPAPAAPQIQPNVQNRTLAQPPSVLQAPLAVAPSISVSAPGKVEMPVQTVPQPAVRPNLATNVAAAPASVAAPAPIARPSVATTEVLQPVAKTEERSELKKELKAEAKKEVAKSESAPVEKNIFLEDGVPNHRNAKTSPAKVAKTANPVAEQPVQTASLSQSENIRVNFASVQPAQSAKKPEKMSKGGQRDIVVVVDAGHGGHDVGAVGSNGTYEKDVDLAVAKTLAELIEREPGMKAVLTRSTDEFVTLRRRMEIARENKADLFVSIHADAYQDTRVGGASVYILSNKGASNEATRLLAQRENAAAHLGGVGLEDMDPDLKEVLMDLSQNVTIEQSHDIAERVLSHLEEVGRMRKTDVLRGGFVVLKSPDVPSILVETAYITNPTEERKLVDPSHQKQIASSILAGVREYFASRPPSGTLYAQKKGERVAAR